MTRTNDRKSSGKNMVSRRDFLKSSALVSAGVATGSLIDLPWPKSAMAQPPSGTITVVHSSDLDTYDVHPSIAGNSKAIAFHIYESLVDRDYKPLLATSWENPDHLTWIFHLKKDVAFTNGEPFTASVVKFNLERVMNPQTKARYRGLLKELESIEVMDEQTVKIKTKRPYGVFIFAMREMSMMSPKAISELGKEITRKAVGTGPYILKEWVPNEKHILEANPDYHGTKAKTRTLIWRPVPEPSTRIVELKSGNADIADKIPPELSRGIAGKELEIIRQRSAYRMGIKLHCGKPPFDNVKARQAFNYAVNKADLIQYVLRGAGYMTAGYLGPHHQGYNPNLKPYRNDPEKAKKLLAEAGYPKGIDFEIVTPAGRYLKDKALIEAISGQVKPLGFNMKVKALEWGMFIKQYDKSNGYFIGSGYNDPQSTLQMDGDSRLKGFSWAHYHNEDFNQRLDQALETFDAKKRARIYSGLSKTMWDDAVYLYMHDAQDIYGVNKRVKDFKPRADAWIFLTKAYLA